MLGTGHESGTFLGTAHLRGYFKNQKHQMGMRFGESKADLSRERRGDGFTLWLLGTSPPARSHPGPSIQSRHAGFYHRGLSWHEYAVRQPQLVELHYNDYYWPRTTHNWALVQVLFWIPPLF